MASRHRTYVLTIRFEFRSVDDASARQHALTVLRQLDVECTDRKLQQIYDVSPPRKVKL